MLKFIVPASAGATELKNFLRQQGISLTQWRKIKRQGQILINNQLIESSAVNVHPGDQIIITWPTQANIQPMPLPLTICFEDEYLLVVNKPPNLLVHPSRNAVEPTLANGIIYYFQETKQALGFHPVHRLDRQTSGLVVVAKLPYIQHLLSLNNAKALNRTYLAVVTGKPPDEGEISAPIGRHPNSIIERMVRPDGQPAITRYRVLERFRQVSLVEIQLLTGRTHQIRVHMAHIGHPLLGDDLYGGSKQLIARQALHAAKISFEHPVIKKLITITTNLPDDMHNLIVTLRSYDDNPR